eukprot:1798097-Amphidinium_carterae.1
MKCSVHARRKQNSNADQSIAAKSVDQRSDLALVTQFARGLVDEWKSVTTIAPALASVPTTQVSDFDHDMVCTHRTEEKRGGQLITVDVVSIP